MRALLVGLLVWGCGAAPPGPQRRFSPSVDGAPLLAGVAYGPYRVGQHPDGAQPSAAQVLEDLRLMAPRWGMIRVYGSGGATPTVLAQIRAHAIPIRVVLGAWIAPDAAAENAAEVARAIQLANAYPDVVIAVSVGNETQVEWSGHRSSRAELIGHLWAVRRAVRQPVTTADDYNFWNKPESRAVAAEVDFILLHAYAMWNGQTLDQAVPWTAAIVRDIAARHPRLPVVLGETGWATALNPEGREVAHIKAPAGAAEQARFYAEFTAWAHAASQPYFYFEAFDEPWKGSADPREVEKHWGLFTVDRQPKAALRGGTR